MAVYKVSFPGEKLVYEAEEGMTLLAVENAAGLQPDAPCGGTGKCGKCKAYADGTEVLACQYRIYKDTEVYLQDRKEVKILTEGLSGGAVPDGTDRYVIAFDIGTTTVVAYLMDGLTGKVLATASRLNPQSSYGGDVISRIEYVLEHRDGTLKNLIRNALSELTLKAAAEAGIDPSEITVASVVGNTAMHHLFMGIDPSPLVVPPYMPAQFNEMVISSSGILPINPDGRIRILPNIAGFVGADTVGCMAATRFDTLEDLTLMIDIGTNGEMVLGNKDRRLACSTAAGPAFEGSKITFGMRGTAGAIDKVFVEDGKIGFTVIGNTEPQGICGSGLLDAVYSMLKTEKIDESGAMDDEDGDPNWTTYGKLPAYTLKGDVCLTQKDVRETQLAKGAIRAGIELMAKHLGVSVSDIKTVYLAGAFGNYLSPVSACGIGMIPPELLLRIKPIGNAAGEGAKMSALSISEFEYAEKLARGTEFLELASRPEFQDTFVDCMMFGDMED